MKITTAWEMGKGGPELMGMWGGDAEGTRHMVQVLMRRGAPVRELVLNVPDSAIESLFATPEVEATPDTNEHTPFPDDGVAYCGWDGQHGCGEVWPCSTVRAALGEGS